MKTAATPLLIAAVLVAACSDPATASIDGYAWPVSVTPGDSVFLCVSTDAPTFDVAIFRVGARDVLVWSATSVPGLMQSVPDSAWEGCDWLPSVALVVPPDWPSGVYLARLAPNGMLPPASWAIFTVVSDEPGVGARILVQSSVATGQAYNAWGGRSLYDSQSIGGQRAHVVSFRRPYDDKGASVFRLWEEPLIRWLEGAGFAVEYCTDLDTHANAALLPTYDVFVVAGHD